MSVKKTSAEYMRRHNVVALIEMVRGTGPIAVDRENGIIRGVKVLGYESKRGHTYTKTAVTKARGMYEGRAVNIDHDEHGKEGNARNLEKRFGRLQNVRESGDGLYADLHYLKAHPMADRVCESAERMPDVMGLSQHAFGREVKRGGKTYIEEITHVRSVDLVSDPATTKGLFEDATMEDDGMGTAVAAEPVSTDPADSIKSGFRSAILAVLDGEGDVAAMAGKIKDLLKAQEQAMSKLEGKPDKPADGEKPAEEKAAAESAKAVAPSAELIKLIESNCRLQLQVAGLAEPPAVLIEAMCKLDSDEKRAAFAAAQKPAVVTKPRSSSPLFESGNSGALPKEIPTDGKAFAALCR